MNYNRGIILDINTIKDKSQAFYDFAEGSETLEKLLKLLYKNKIETMACCRGHSKEQDAYIKFKLNAPLSPFYQNLLSIMLDIKESEVNIQNTKAFITLDIRIPAIKAEYTFQKLYDMLLKKELIISPKLENIFNISYKLSKLALENRMYSKTVFTQALLNENSVEVEIYTENMLKLEENEQLNIVKYNCSPKQLNNLYYILHSKYSKNKKEDNYDQKHQHRR